MTYNFWEHLPNAGLYMNIIANLHLLTIGSGFRAHVKPMITGDEDINLTPEQEAYLEESEPWRLKAKEG